ncbi:hypothetical protein SAMN05421676_104108 [Salinibacillus kushneri]|uniref:ATP-dependent helicase/deoxyribonuclease subunit B N-terminal domain-containing protein n=1 Tax=Salinibacillus kushneri TaxID=237682 RepID=A0A1I0DPB8_9BACI|nr:hypothetical protein [Salinibacillus kushneri]SET34382.1 hypothetical protein SAMN05421676_104108 [Salinibacillus kushneri]
MHAYIEELYRICNHHPLEEKLVIVDSHVTGEEIYQSYVQYGFSFMNLKIKTIKDLALEVTEIYGDRASSPLEPTLGHHLTYYLLTQLKEENQLIYFSGMEITPSFSKKIYQMISELRLTGYTSENLPQHTFISNDKAQDIKQILARFEQIIDAHQLKDQASLYHQAIQVVTKPSRLHTFFNRIYIYLIWNKPFWKNCSLTTFTNFLYLRCMVCVSLTMMIYEVSTGANRLPLAIYIN